MPDIATKPTGLHALSATEIARRIAAGETTAEAVTRDCLERIEARDGVVRAWAFIDPELALEQARALDRGPVRGALHGVPVGIKDVIDTVDMPTQMGSPIYDGYRPSCDASCVAILRAAGAVILGKTVTCEFAGVEPNVTRNPHNPAHTPGGSSSGSAAAVADFMVPIAFGTQTGGSILRPASFCGVVGYKPSFGTINRAGLKFAAESIDTIGPLTRTVEDAALVTAALVGQPAPATEIPATTPRVGLCLTHLWSTVEPATEMAIEDAAKRLTDAGALLGDAVLPAGFEALSEARETFNEFERARAMAYEWHAHRDRISARLAKSIQNGMAMPWPRYLSARRVVADWRARVDELFDGFDVLLAPCVPGEAPEGLGHTGDPRMQGIWTLLHTPTITLPTHKGPKGLPVGIQLVGKIGEDEALLAAARWVWHRLGPAH